MDNKCCDFNTLMMHILTITYVNIPYPEYKYIEISINQFQWSRITVSLMFLFLIYITPM